MAVEFLAGLLVKSRDICGVTTLRGQPHGNHICSALLNRHAPIKSPMEGLSCASPCVYFLLGLILARCSAWQIENEYTNHTDMGSPGKAEYMQQLEDFVRKHGIVVPLTFNESGRSKQFVDGLGSVDVYGFDSYPQRFDCANPDVWNPLQTDYRTYHAETNPKQPLYIPEFQAGAFDP